MGLEVEDLANTSNYNAATANKRFYELRNDSDERIAKNSSERRDTLHKKSHEGSAVIDNERCDALQRKPNEVSASIMKCFK